MGGPWGGSLVVCAPCELGAWVDCFGAWNRVREGTLALVLIV